MRFAGLKALFRCSNHKGNRLATLMIQGAAAAYARLPRKLFKEGKISSGRRVEIWPQYSAMAVFYVAHLRFTAPLLTI